MTARRPAFPAGWNSINISQDELCLRNTLPVGQTFIWHRHALPSPSIIGPKIETSDVLDPLNIEAKSDGDVIATASHGIREEAIVKQEIAVVHGTDRLSQAHQTNDIKIGVGAFHSSVAVKQEDGAIPLAYAGTMSVAESSTSLNPPDISVPVKMELDLKSDFELEGEEEPVEEYSRAIPHPDRVLLLRQSSKRIWFASVQPPDSTHPPIADNNQDHKEGVAFSEPKPTSSSDMESLDRAFLMDYFRLLPPSRPLTENFSIPTEAPSSPLSSPPADLESSHAIPALTLPLPYQAQYEHWKTLDPLLLGKALDNGWLPRGVRVVRQEGWECLISFITSSANNVPRITSLVHKLQDHYSPVLLTLPHPTGEGSGPATVPLNTAALSLQAGPNEAPLEVNSTAYRLFPRPSALASDHNLDQTLRLLGFGYRAGFIVSSLKLLIAEHGSPALGECAEPGSRTAYGVQDFLASLRTVPAGEWRNELIRLKGVGRKVADCIGLMSMDRSNVVPIDTHLQQIAARHPRFPAKLKHKATSTETVYNQVQDFLTSLWGGSIDQSHLPGNGFAGWAQAVMFAADLKGSTAVDLKNGKASGSGSPAKKRKAGDESDEGKRGGKTVKSIKFDKDTIKTDNGAAAGSSKTRQAAIIDTKPFSHPSKVKALKVLPTIEQQLTGSPYDPNPLVPLLSLARHPEPEVVHKSIWALYRVYIKFIAEDRFQGLGLLPFDRTRSSADVKDQSKIVRRWMEERLYDYADILAGCLRDKEPSLRKSASSLIFSFLPPLSENLSKHIGRPQIATAYLAYVLDALVLSSVSLRGSLPVTQTRVEAQGQAVNNPTGQWQILEENQCVTGSRELPGDVVHDAGKRLADYDDLRWAVFRGFSSMIDSYSAAAEGKKTNNTFPAHMSGNILSLILPLNNLPQDADDINEFYFPHLSKKPSKSSASASKKTKRPTDKKGDAENPQSWMDFFDSSEDEASSEEEIEIEVDKKTGVKRKRTKKVKVKKDVHNLVWSVVSQKKVFTDCWLGVLSMPLSQAETRSILLVLHSVLFPNLIRGRVVRITDWLGGLCDQGGPLALLSLNGLFILMSKYNLEYPHFYRRLYGFMDREVLHVRHRARFFRLTETFLRSPLLPAALIASFVKRLARLSLSAPPSSAVMTIPFIYNMLKRHPSCMGMLHRPTAVIAPTGDDDGDENDSDPFDADEKDPLKTGALDSSLWELKSLQKHYLSHVSTMGKIFEEVFTKPEFNLDDFLDHTYATLFETEVKRRLKNAPALATDKTSNAFVLAGGEAFGQAENQDVINELFSFSK